jgi:hypothetical protein
VSNLRRPPVPTVRVTCPECDFTFSIADSRVGGLITCRDCKSEFRVEFAEDEEEPPAAGTREEAAPDAPDDRPSRRPAPRTRSRVDADHEPEEWKTDLPIRSPVPLLLILTGLQVLAAGFLMFYWFVPVGSATYSPTTSYYSSYPTAPKATLTVTPSTRR